MILLTKKEFLKSEGKWHDLYSCYFNDNYALIKWLKVAHAEMVPKVQASFETSFPSIELEERIVKLLREEGYIVLRSV